MSRVLDRARLHYLELGLKEWLKCPFAKESLKGFIQESIVNKTIKGDTLDNLDNPDRILASIGFGLMLKQIDADRVK
jgi:hypothetical protein